MPVQQIIHKILDKVRIYDDVDGRPVNRWTNPDILPVLPKNRTFTTKAYVSYWISGAVCASFWSMGSSAIANGLTAGQAIGAMLVGGVISAIIAWLCGRPGIKYHLGFPMMSRVTFGMFGSYFIVVLKCFTNFLYCGIQTYWGGLAVHVILAAVFPSFHRMKNTLPASANITTADLTGTIIYICFFVPLLLIKPYKLHKFFMFSFFGVITTILGMFIWAMAANRGAGDLVAPAKKLSTGDRAFVFIQAICTVCGSFTGSSIRHSDWSRYAKTPKSPLLGIWFAGPLALTLTAMFGVFVTSAARAMYGQILWQPLSLLLYIQKTSYTPGVRAGTFFAGLGWFLSQLAVNISLNSVAAGMDLTSVLPTYLSAKRGGLLLAFVGSVCCPWNFVNSPGTFVTVLSSFGLFVSPLIGIYMADFWVVRGCNWRVPDLYIGDNRSVYWYTGGWHWRGFVGWLGIIWMSLPGFVTTVRGTKIALAWTRIFQITFFVGKYHYLLHQTT
ncbi:permease for cytosine/purines, uracil, thiamine, allantoin-domain-containing protein [Tricladium varicosporioides]|nr:permease for cytosine/purines, uracil, thiamine, allantoin-domain-containing protein [Hymenoscyphus varicosporioides]